MRLSRILTLCAVAISTPALLRAQSTDRQVERLAETIAATVERAAAQVEKHATAFANGFEREWNRQQRDDRDRRRRRSSDTIDRPTLDTTVAFSSDGTVDLTNVAGDIVVTGWDRKEVRIKARSERGDLEYSLSNSRITIEERAERGRWSRRDDSEDTRYELSVPRGVRVIAHSTSGDIKLRGTGGEVEANTLSGDVSVEDATRRVEVGTVSGEVSGTRLKGTIEANSVSGGVTLDDVEGDVRIESTSGDLSITNAKSREIDASTTSGEIVFAGSLAADGRYEFHSHSGNVELTVPSAINAHFSVETYSGELGSDFPITLQPGQRAGARGRRFEFNVGTGGARVIAETFSGNLDIRKK